LDFVYKTKTKKLAVIYVSGFPSEQFVETLEIILILTRFQTRDVFSADV